MLRSALLLSGVLLYLTSAPSSAGVVATLEVDYFAIPDGRVRYEYTLANAPDSEFPLDILLLDTGEGVHIDFEVPAGWFVDFAPEEETYEVLFLAEQEGLLQPGQSATFVLISAATPDILPYFVANQLHSFEEGGYVLGETLVPYKAYALRPGDTNADGIVDIVDLNNVRNNFAATGDPILGDTDPFDGTVGLYDLNQVYNNFGRNYGPQAVPEPNSWALAIVSGLFTAGLGRRRLPNRKTPNWGLFIPSAAA